MNGWEPPLGPWDPEPQPGAFALCRAPPYPSEPIRENSRAFSCSSHAHAELRLGDPREFLAVHHPPEEQGFETPRLQGSHVKKRGPSASFRTPWRTWRLGVSIFLKCPAMPHPAQRGFRCWKGDWELGNSIFRTGVKGLKSGPAFNQTLPTPALPCRRF